MTGSRSTPSRPLCPRTAAGRHPPRPGAPPLLAIPARADGQAVLTLAGDIDLITAGAVREEARRCLRGRPARLLLNLRLVGFCDAAGARALRLAQDEAAAADAEFRLIPPGPPVIRVLTLIGAGDLLSAVQSPRSRQASARLAGTRRKVAREPRRGVRRVTFRACRAGALPASDPLLLILFAAWRWL